MHCLAQTAVDKNAMPTATLSNWSLLRHTVKKNRTGLFSMETVLDIPYCSLYKHITHICTNGQ